MQPQWLLAEWKFGHDGARAGNFVRQLNVFGGINNIETAGEDRHCGAARFKGPSMGRRINPPR